MYRKRIICFSCFICIAVLAILGMLGRMTLRVERVSFAQNYDELQLYVQYSAGAEPINIWKDEDSFYFFLPANVGSGVSFGNLQSEDSIIIAGHAYQQNDNIWNEIPFDTACNMQLTIDGEVLPEQKVVFMHSENLPAVFIETDSGTVDAIHSDRTIKEKAKVSLMNAQGSCEFRGGIEYIKARGNSTFSETEKRLIK